MGLDHGSPKGVKSPRREASSPRTDGTPWAHVPLAPTACEFLNTIQARAR